MAPELAAGYVIGWIPSLAVTGLHFWLHKKKEESPAVKQLQKNLSSVQKYWSESQGHILELSENSLKNDKDMVHKSLWIMGALFFFLSWLGFLFNLLILISVHSLAISRTNQSGGAEK